MPYRLILMQYLMQKEVYEICNLEEKKKGVINKEPKLQSNNTIVFIYTPSLTLYKFGGSRSESLSNQEKTN